MPPLDSDAPGTSPAAAASSRQLDRLPAACALLAASLGAATLAGWATGRPLLASLAPGLIAMLPITAAAFVAAAAGLWLQRRPLAGDGPPGAPAHALADALPEAPGAPIARRAGRALAAVILVLGVVMLAQRVSGVELRALNLLLFRDAVLAAPYRPPGLMAVNSAVSMTLLGFALLALDARRGWLRRAAEIAATLAAAIAFLALLGYAYGSRALYTFDRYAGMALPTALSFAAIAVGTLAARPARGWVSLLVGPGPTADFARKLLAVGAVVPIVLGRLWIEARRHELITREVGVAIFVAMVVAVFAAVVLHSAAILRRSEVTRERALAAAEEHRRSAEAANRTKSEFLAVMSHELRTPLNAIAGHAQLLEMELHGPVTPEQRDALERIRRNQHHLLRLIDDVLLFARIEGGRIDYLIEDVQLAEALEDVAPMVEPQLAAKRIAFDTSVPPSCVVRADRDKLAQILINLLGNAAKFTPEDGRVSVDCTQRAGAGDVVFLRVTDTGPGIPREKLAAIFEPFVQGDMARTRSAGGVGLGLTISRDLARGMGGEIRARSSDGRGATFTLSLPRGGRTVTPAGAAPSVPAGAAARAAR